MKRTVAVALALASSAVAGPTGAADTPLWTNAAAPRKGPGVLGFADLAERARAAVVHVRGEAVEGTSDGDGGKTSIGTGFIIGRDGYIITNEHVIRGAGDLRVRLYDGRELAACVA